MKKRGQAGLITTIILIMVVLVSIIIVWNLVFGILNSSSGQTGMDQFSTSLDIPLTKIYITGGAQVQVHRSSGAGNISSLIFNFQKNNGEIETVTINTNLPSELETKTYEFLPSQIGFNFKEITKISVVPLFGKKPGITSEETNYQKDSSGNRIPELPDTSTTQGKQILQEGGLISWWKFNGNAQDSVGDNNGTVYGAVFLIDSQKGTVLNFSGNCTNYVTLLHSTQILPKFTLSAWVYHVQGNTTLSRHAILSYYWEIVGQQIGYIDGSFIPTGWRYSTGNIVPYNQWSHITTTWNGTTIKHYVNGDLKWTDPIPATGTGQFTNIANTVNCNPTYIGDSNYNRPFVGKLSNVMIFNRSLSSDEILAIYNN